MRNLLSGVLLLVSIAVFGEKQNEVFLNFNTGNSMLQHNTVEAITVDHLGYIWVGTDYGLYRFDGYSTQPYLHLDSVPNSLSSNSIKALHVDNDGDLWVGTIGGGLNVLDRENNCFKHFLTDSSSYLLGNNILSIADDRKGNIWIGTTKNGVAKLNKKSGRISYFNLTNYDPNKHENSNVNVLYTDKEGNVWVGLNQSELFKIDANSEIISYHGLTSNDIGVEKVGSIKGIAEKKDGTLLIATWHGNLYTLNLKKSNKIQLWKDSKFFNKSVLTSIAVDSKDFIWIGTWSSGLYRFNPTTDELIQFNRDLERSNSLSSNGIVQLKLDKKENLWICTADNGLSMLSVREKMFKTLELKQNVGGKKEEANVYSIIKDKAGNFIIGTRGQGLWIYNFKTGLSTNLNSSNSGLKNNSIVSAKLKADGTIWFGTDGGFVSLFDPEKQTFNQLPYRYDDWSNCVFAIAENDDFLWCGTWGGGIKRVDKKTFNYTSIEFESKDQFKNSVFDLDLQDSILWVANVGLGLIRYNIFTQKYHIYSKENGSLNCPEARITDICVENENSLWISSEGSGFYHFIPQTGEFINYNFQNNLVSSVIQGSVIDKNRNIWLATNSGITLFKPDQKIAHNFSLYNGLNSMQLNKSAIFFDKDENRIYCGSIGGVNYFNPDNIVIDSTINKIIFTDIIISGKKLIQPNNHNISAAIDMATEVHLFPKEKIFTLHFSSMEFSPSEKAKYYYQLEGFSDTWNETPYKKNYVQYANLSPGTYILRVKNCNSDGICSEDEATLKIIVHPAFWQTFLFRLLILILIIFGIFLYTRNRYSTLILAQRELEKRVWQRTEEIQLQKEQIEKQNAELELANQAKDKFFSIISHDLKNPLSSIDQLIGLIINQYPQWNEERLNQYLKMLKKSSGQTLELLDDLLIWARTQTKRISINKTNFGLDDLCEELKSYCLPLAKNKNIALKFPASCTHHVFADKNTLQLVLRNLITNAIKFSHPNSSVIVEIEEHKSEIVVKVIDYGIGMTPNEVQKLFKVDKMVSKKGTAGELGSGLGLILCYEFLLLNGGHIWVESERGKGSTFFFSLPIVP
jgi:signal transduction histidine kinase/ligand-binding sensor domain-containing protein